MFSFQQDKQVNKTKQQRQTVNVKVNHDQIQHF